MIDLKYVIFFCLFLLTIQSASAATFTDDFNDGNIDGWYIYGPGTYSAIDYYVKSVVSASNTKIIHNTSNSDRFFRFDFRGISEESGNMYFCFMYKSPNSSCDRYYRISHHIGDNNFSVFANGWTEPEIIPLPPDEWLTLESTVNETHIHTVIYYRDSRELLFDTVAAFTIPSSGWQDIALFWYSSTSHTHIDNILVNDVPVNPYTEPLSDTDYILFSADNYSLNSLATINYMIWNPDFYNYYYLAELENPAGQVVSTSAMSIGSDNPESFTHTLDSPGTWRAHLWQCQLSNSECNVFLGYDIANVSSSAVAQGGSIDFYSDVSETNRITAIDTGNVAYMRTSVDNINTSKYTYQVLISNPDSVGVDYENVIVSPQSFRIDTSYPMYIRSGAYTFRLVSTNIITGASQTLATATLAILDDYPGSGYLNFSKANYNLGEQMSIAWNVSNGNFSKYAYSIELYGTDGSLQRVIGLNSASGTTSPEHDMTRIGSYSAWLYAQKYGSVSKQLITIAQTQYGSTAGGVTGNISLDKSTYNRTETVQISYNISTNGRLDIQTPTTMYAYAVSAGTDQHSTFYIPQDGAFGTYTIYLEYFDGLVWTYIDHETFTVTYIGQNMIEFSDPRKIYIQGDTMTVNAIGIDAGYIRITDSNSMIKLNATITANSLTSYNYYVAFTDPAGIWTAKLYNSTGSEVASDSADVYTSGYGQPSPTATIPSVTSTSGTVDYVGNKTARKQAENSFLNTFYGGMNGLFVLAILATMMFFLKGMGKWR